MSVDAGVAFGFLAACCLAAQAIFIRLGTRHGSSNNAVLIVATVNVAAIVPAAFIIYPDVTVTVRAIIAFSAAGLVGPIIGRALFFAGIKQVGASRASPIKASTPIHATILAVLLLGEHVGGYQFAGIILIFLGIALISREGQAADRLAGKKTSRLALSLPFAAAFLFGLEAIFATVGLDEGVPVLVGLAIKAATAWVGFMAYMAWKNSLSGPRQLQTNELSWCVLAGLMNTGFMVAYYAGLEVSRVSIVVPIQQTSPLLIVVFSAIFLRQLERVTLRVLAAAVVIVLGGMIVTLTS